MDNPFTRALSFMKPSIRNTFIIGAAVAIFMFAFSFALVPLYNVYCRPLGINITERDNKTLPVLERNVTIQFVTLNNANLPWEFHPNMTSIRVHPEGIGKVTFYAKNNSDHTMTVQAIPSFAPVFAGRYFHKIECFCFSKQTLSAGTSMNMAVVFRIDKNLPPEISTITLAYTLFDVTKKGKPSHENAKI